MTLQDQLNQIAAGQHPRFITRLSRSVLLLGDVQPLPGYGVLIADPPILGVHTASAEDRAAYWADAMAAGDAILAAQREHGAEHLNFETWCNLDPTLHTHIVPRFNTEPADLRKLPPREAYDWTSVPFDPDRDAAVMGRIGEAIEVAGV